MSDAELLERFSSDQALTDIHNISQKDGNKGPIYIVTFAKERLPDHITTFGKRNIPVEPFTPKPRQCKNCFEFGHGERTCRKDRVCGKCGSKSADHDHKSCTELKCSNCGQQHEASSSDCPQLQIEVAVISHSSATGVDLRHAREHTLRTHSLVNQIPKLRDSRDRLRPLYASVAAENQQINPPTQVAPPPKQDGPAPLSMQDMADAMKIFATEITTTLKTEMQETRNCLEQAQATQNASLLEAINENTKALKLHSASLKAIESKVDANTKNINVILSLPHIQSQLQMKPPPHPPQPAPGEKGGAAPLVRSRLSQSLNRDNRRSSLSPSPSRGTNMDDQMVTDPHKGEKRPRSPPAGTGTASGNSDVSKPEPKAKKAIEMIYYDRHKDVNPSDGSQRATKHKYTHVQV